MNLNCRYICAAFPTRALPPLHLTRVPFVFSPTLIVPTDGDALSSLRVPSGRAARVRRSSVALTANEQPFGAKTFTSACAFCMACRFLRDLQAFLSCFGFLKKCPRVDTRPCAVPNLCAYSCSNLDGKYGQTMQDVFS